MITINLEIKDAKKFNDLEIGDYFIFIEKNIKASDLCKKISENTYRHQSDRFIKLSRIEENLPIIQVLNLNYAINESVNKKELSAFEKEVKEEIYRDSPIILRNDSIIDQAFIINNQASKISDQEAEIKKLERIIINQAEIIGNKSNG